MMIADEESLFSEMVVREAFMHDIPVMAAHHRKMFVEILQLNGECIEPAKAIELEKAYALKLANEMAMESCRAWVVEDKRKIVASGAISTVSLVPTPVDLSPQVAYLHSMYTEKSHRGRKCAGRIVETIIEHCKVHGIRRIMLNASDAGRPVYQKLGFCSVADMMRLII